MRRTEQAVIIRIVHNAILLEDDFGETIYVHDYFVTGTPRIGATCTVLHTHGNTRAFVEPEERPTRIASDPDESGVQIIGHTISEILRAVN